MCFNGINDYCWCLSIYSPLSVSYYTSFYRLFISSSLSRFYLYISLFFWSLSLFFPSFFVPLFLRASFLLCIALFLPVSFLLFHSVFALHVCDLSCSVKHFLPLPSFPLDLSLSVHVTLSLSEPQLKMSRTQPSPHSQRVHSSTNKCNNFTLGLNCTAYLTNENMLVPYTFLLCIEPGYKRHSRAHSNHSPSKLVCAVLLMSIFSHGILVMPQNP